MDNYDRKNPRKQPDFVVTKVTGVSGGTAQSDQGPSSPMAARETVVGILNRGRANAKHVGYTRRQG